MSQIWTSPYCSSNKFDSNMSEVFSMIRNEPVRVLNQLLMAQPKISLEAHYHLNITPLMEAVSIEHLGYVQYICNKVKEQYTKNNILNPNYKKYINQISTDGKSALFMGILMNGDTQVIEYLIEQGALLDLVDYSGKSIFHYARYATSEKVEDYIMSLQDRKVSLKR